MRTLAALLLPPRSGGAPQGRWGVSRNLFACYIAPSGAMRHLSRKAGADHAAELFSRREDIA